MEKRNLLDEKTINRLQELAGIIYESKVGDIFNKYYKDIRLDLFYDIIKADPTTPLKDGKPDKLGQYSKWLLSLHKKDRLRKEDLYKATEYLTIYHELKNKNILPNEFRDIGKIPDLPTMYALNSRYGGTGEVKADENYLITDQYFINTNKAQKFFENKRWLVIIPNTYEASKFYGCTSQWCTRFPDMYQHYTKDGPLYILIDKLKLNQPDALKRYQFHFESHQFMNMNDSGIDVGEFFRNNPSLIEPFELPIANYVANSTDLTDKTLALLALVIERDPTAADRFLPAMRTRIMNGKPLPEQIMESIPGLVNLYIQIYSENGWTLDEKYLAMLDAENLQKAIERKMLKGAYTVPPHYFKHAANRLKVFYYKDIIKRGLELPAAVAAFSDPRLLDYYFEEMTKLGKPVPEWVYNSVNDDKRREYRNKLVSGNKFHFIEPAQFAELDEKDKKSYLNKYVQNMYSFMPNAFFKVMSKDLRNHYIGQLVTKKGMDKVVNFLTKEQYKWATTDGFLA